MSDSDSRDDVTWEDFFGGSSSDLMPSIMGAFDSYLIPHQQHSHKSELSSSTSASSLLSEEYIFTASTPKRTNQLNNFASLSPVVQKILSNVPEQEINKKFNSEELLGPTVNNSNSRRNRFGYRSLRCPDKNKSNESLDLSPGVHKMLSNLQDSELVISATNLHVNVPKHFAATATRNSSYLYSSEITRSKLSLNSDGGSGVITSISYTHNNNNNSNNNSDNKITIECDQQQQQNYIHKPLGSYLHSDKGIASRTPVGRKNMGKYLQIPSVGECSSGIIISTAATTTNTTNSTTSSSSTTTSDIVSRPVSLTSLASCSSSESGSGGGGGGGIGENKTENDNQHQDQEENVSTSTSMYLASAESLDSDPEPAGSQGSADSGIAEQDQSPLSAEQRVMHEVLDTETIYLADLNEVITGYLELWRNDENCPFKNYLPDLFSNIEAIYDFNKKILEDLRHAHYDPSKIANVFLINDSGFKVYMEYCTNYPRTMEVLSNLQKDSKMACYFREKQQLLGHALPLGSYLLKPVQRILKYRLLLQRLSKHCNDGQHKATVDLALTTMTGVAAEINNMKRKHEHAVRVQEIQSQLYGWTGADLTTFGELIGEGTFRVQGARGRRHVFLFEKMLLLAKSKTGGTLAYKTHIECSNLMLVEQVRGDPLSFQVLPFDNPRLQCTLRARSAYHKREWTLQIKRAILENYSAVIPSHARQLVMQLGQDTSNESGVAIDDPAEKWIPLKHNATTPHYLERRSRRKTQEVTMKDSARALSQDRTFSSLTNWRRKSEPSMIAQQAFESKTMPQKKQTKLKKETSGSSTFYTDLTTEQSDGGSSELAQETVNVKERRSDGDHSNTVDSKTIGNNLAKIVSELIMQNQDFNKVFNREHHRHPRRNINSEPGPMWYTERPELPSKADSLPRSFQLNDPVDGNNVGDGRLDEQKKEQMKLNKPEEEMEESRNIDLSPRLDESDYPEHKIYRKSAIRLSILNKLRAVILSEDQKSSNTTKLLNNNNTKQTTTKTGEKLANPDYADPQKLFPRTASDSMILEKQHNEQDEENFLLNESLDMTISEKEVLQEVEKRLNTSSSQNGTPHHRPQRISPSDSYYETILDDSLSDESYVQDKLTGKLVLKSDSFSNPDKIHLNAGSNTMRSYPIRAVSNGRLKPTRKPPPPPVPAKPLRLTKHWINKEPIMEIDNNYRKDCSIDSTDSGNDGGGRFKQAETGRHLSQNSWVKTMVERFE